MSYILDALRRAEAERGRGAVPGIHSQALPVPGNAAAATRAMASPVWIAAMVASVAVVAAAGAWWVTQRSAPQGGVVVATGSAPPSAAVAAPPAKSAIAPAAPVVTPAVAPVLIAPAEPVVPAPPVKRAAAPSREKADRAPGTAPVPSAGLPRPRSAETLRAPVREPAGPVRREPPPAAAAATGTAGTPPPSPISATGTVFAQTDLPDSVRGQLPVLKISGITYSSNPVSRMAIVNGQVLHEGDPAAPGLLLERIEPGRTVWSFRGYRYGLAP